MIGMEALSVRFWKTGNIIHIDQFKFFSIGKIIKLTLQEFHLGSFVLELFAMTITT
jgi:hypothetical protein